MGVFRRKQIDQRSAGGQRADDECPVCGHAGVIDYVDLVQRTTSRRCVRCDAMWSSSEATVGATR